jgi:Flp pilus assembly protein TadB
MINLRTILIFSILFVIPLPSIAVESSEQCKNYEQVKIEESSYLNQTKHIIDSDKKINRRFKRKIDRIGLWDGKDNFLLAFWGVIGLILLILTTLLFTSLSLLLFIFILLGVFLLLFFVAFVLGVSVFIQNS